MSLINNQFQALQLEPSYKSIMPLTHAFSCGGSVQERWTASPLTVPHSPESLASLRRIASWYGSPANLSNIQVETRSRTFHVGRVATIVSILFFCLAAASLGAFYIPEANQMIGLSIVPPEVLMGLTGACLASIIGNALVWRKGSMDAAIIADKVQKDAVLLQDELNEQFSLTENLV